MPVTNKLHHWAQSWNLLLSLHKRHDLKIRLPTENHTHPHSRDPFAEWLENRSGGNNFEDGHHYPTRVYTAKFKIELAGKFEKLVGKFKSQ